MGEAAREAVLRICDAGVEHWFSRGGSTKDFANPALRSLRGQAVLADVEHPGGGHARAEVIIHVLDAYKACVIYPGMIHKGSSIVLHLPQYEQGARETKGHSIDCRHLSGSMHAVLLTFDSPVNLVDMFAPGVILPASAEPTIEADSKQFHGTCAILGSDALDSRMIGYLAERLGLQSTQVGDIGSLLDTVTGSEFDLVMIDSNVISRNGGIESIAARLYRVGLRAGLILITPSGIKDSSDLDRLGELQIRAVCRPITKELLGDAVEDILKGVEPGVPGVIASTLTDPEAKELVLAYINQLMRDMDTVMHGRDGGDLGVVRETVIRWRETGSSYGFGALSTAAKSAVMAMDASMSLEESAPELRRALSVVRRIVSGGGSTSPDRFVA